MHIMPVWQTSGISPYLPGPNGPYGPYRSESAMLAQVANYAQTSYTAGIELNQKQPYGILWTIANWANTGGTQKALANFNPYAEWINPNDGYGTYQFFYSNGYCCGVPRNWFYNGAPTASLPTRTIKELSGPFC
jgi:hypothetical protein